MRELNYKNQHEIGFDIDCLPKWANYIATDEDDVWTYFIDIPRPCVRGLFIGMWHADQEYYTPIPTDYAPKNFTGNWEESLFKINWESSVHYNGTAI